jgi:trigger factor
MDVQIEETGPVERKLRVQIATADVDAAFDGVYKALSKGARIAGFRPGKVPRSVMERYFGDRARGEVLERLIQESLPKAVDDADLNVVGQPQLEPGEPPQEGAPFEFEATFDVRPEIELKKTRGLELVRPELPEPEEDPIERHLEELRLQHAQLSEEEAGTAAAAGHQAVIDYDATIDGQAFDGSSGSETVVELGEGRAIPGLEDQLIGLQVGDERSFELELPETYPGEDTAGKTAQFHVKLVGLKRRELPDLDDELAKDASDFETLDALKADLNERLTSSREREAERLLRQTAIDALVEANPFPVPGSLVEHQLEHRLRRALGQLQQLPAEEQQRLVDGWREEWRDAAERDVRMGLLVDDIAAAESIEVSDDDVEAQIKSIAEAQDVPLQQVVRSYREQGVFDTLRRGLLEECVVDFLISEATVSDT